MIEPFPSFHTVEVTGKPSVKALVGSVSSTRYGHNEWIGHKWWGYLKFGDRFIEGRWHKRWFHQRDPWRFVLRKPALLSSLHAVKTFEVLHGYWGELAALVLNPDLVWTKVLWVQPQEDWKHEHCNICLATIWLHENQEHYESSAGDQVCSACYHDHVSQRDLSFIASWRDAPD